MSHMIKSLFQRSNHAGSQFIGSKVLIDNQEFEGENGSYAKHLYSRAIRKLPETIK